MKQTEIGLIPEDWEVKSLGEIGEPCMCKRILKEQTSSTGDVPFYKIGTFGGIPDAYISRELFEQYKEQYNYPKKGTLLLSAAGTIGRVVVFDGKDSYFQDSNIVWIDNDETKVTNDFLFYCYSRMQWKTEEGGIVSRLYNANLKSTSFIAPKSLAEQQRIAKALSDVDALISTTEKLIQKKKNIKQGAMQNLLTGKKRLPGFGEKQADLFVPNGTHTKEVKDVSPEQIRLSAKMKQTELGEIPEDWEVKSIKDFAKVYDGTHQTPHYVDVGIPFYSVENVTANDFEHTKLISEKEHRLLTSKVKIEKGNILMTRIGSIGDCKYIDWEPEASFYVSLALIKCDTSVDARFISYYSNSLQFKKELELRSLITAIPQKINLGPISEIILVLPPKEEQTAIANVLSSMDKEIETLNTKLEKYRNLKTAMMQQLLTGKIRL